MSFFDCMCKVLLLKGCSLGYTWILIFVKFLLCICFAFHFRAAYAERGLAISTFVVVCDAINKRNLLTTVILNSCSHPAFSFTVAIFLAWLLIFFLALSQDKLFRLAREGNQDELKRVLFVYPPDVLKAVLGNLRTPSENPPNGESPCGMFFFFFFFMHASSFCGR